MKINFPSLKNKILPQDFWYLLIFLVPLILNPWGNVPYEIPKIGFSLVFIGAGIFLFTIKILSGKKLFYNKKVLTYIGFWLLSLSLSTFFSLNPQESFWGLSDRLQGLLQWIFYIFHFLICFQIFNDKKLKSLFFKIILICGSLVSACAILQFLRLDPFPIGNIDLFNGRSYSTIGQPNMLGQWLIFPFFVAIFNIFHKDNSTKQKILYSFLFLLFSAALLTTLNRATFLGIGIAFIILFSDFLIKKNKKAFLFLGLTILLTAIFILASGSVRSLESRSVLWQEALTLIPKTPILGKGPEAYYQASQTALTKEIYETENLYDAPDRVHNETLQVLLDQGTFGFILYLIPIIFLLWCIKKQKINSTEAKISFFALIATYISLQFSFTFSAEMIYFLAFWAILLTEFKNTNQIQLKPSLTRNILITPVVLLITFFAFIYSANIIKADQLVDQSFQLYLDDKQQSWSLIQKAINLNPHNANYLNLSMGLFGTPDFIANNPKTTDILKKQDEIFSKLTNQDYKYLETSAKLDYALGNLNLANSKFQLALQKAPSWTMGWQEWGEFLLKQGKTTEAIDKLEHVINLAPKFIWQKSEKTRIFNKSNELFYFAVNMLEQAYIQTSQFDKAENLENLIKIKEETNSASS